MSARTWLPVRKWWATQITAVATLAVAWVNAGAWNKALSIALIGLVSQAGVSYLIPNGDQQMDEPPTSTGSRLRRRSRAATA